MLQRDRGDRPSSQPCLGSTDVIRVTLLEEHLQAVKNGKSGGESMEVHPDRGYSILTVLKSRTSPRATVPLPQ